MKVKKETIIRTAVLVLALVNQLLESTGHSVLPFDSEQLASMISAVFTIAAALWAWWKNNSFTSQAIQADEYLEEIRKRYGK